MEQYTIPQLCQAFPQKFCVCSVASRNSDGVADGYEHIATYEKLEGAEVSMQDDLDAVIIPTFYGDDDSFMSPSDYARFVRIHFGLDRFSQQIL